MSTLKHSLWLIALVILGASCQRQSVATEGPISIQFDNECEGKPVTYGQINYTNAAGNKYAIKLLKYYITNAVLVTGDNKEVKLNNYDLMDAFSPNGFSTIEVPNLPYGQYTKMRFYLGVDKDRNHSGAQDGDLDPIHNMIWTWATGYLFMKHEGVYINGSGDTVEMQYHLGTDPALSTIEIPIDLTHKAGVKKMRIVFDLNKMYNSPAINFNDAPIRHSTSADDATWIQQMRTNTADAFRFKTVE